MPGEGPKPRLFQHWDTPNPIDQFFNANWLRRYCLDETTALVAFTDRMAAAAIPYQVVRYEYFIASHDVQRALSDFVGWPGGGQTDRHLAQMNRRIGSINAVYFEIEIGNTTLRADAKERLASTIAGDVELATEIREPMWSAGSFEGFVRETWSLLGPAGVSDTAPGVSPASRPCGLRGPPSAWFL